jgi:defect-in-organelle-trafficking protein DotD
MTNRLFPLLSLAGLGLVILTLGGCTTDGAFDFMQPSGGTSVTPIATEPDIVTVKLAQAADKASKALDGIAGIEQQRNPSIKPVPEDYNNAPPALTQPVSIRWAGPIEQITRTLAERAGYRFRVKGREPSVPLSVTIDAYQEPILHVLRDIGLQAGNRADLAVNMQSSVIEIRYAPNDLSR